MRTELPLTAYKKETLQFIMDLHASVEKEFAGELKKLVQMAAKGFNSALEERRAFTSVLRDRQRWPRRDCGSCSRQKLSCLEGELESSLKQ